MNELKKIETQIDTLNLIEYLEGQKKTEKLEWVIRTIKELYSFNESVVKELYLQEIRNFDLETLLLDFNRLKEENKNLKKEI